jgi:hypothetical protein
VAGLVVEREEVVVDVFIATEVLLVVGWDSKS